MDKVLVSCANRYIKGILFRILVEAGLDVSDAADEEDIRFKVGLFGSSIVLFIAEVTEQNRERLYAEIRRLSESKAPVRGTVLALVPNETAEMVGGALKAGIDDVILLPQNRERYRTVLAERLPAVIEKGRIRLHGAPDPVEAPPEEEEERTDPDELRSELLRELKMANRGGHTVSLLMVRCSGLDEDEIRRLEDKLLDGLRDTDRILPFDPTAFIIVCPFTAKSFIVEVERKTRQAYSDLFGDFTHDRRIYLFGTNYPTEEREPEQLIVRMENGIHDSMAFTALREPLHKLTPTEMERFRNKLRLYRL